MTREQLLSQQQASHNTEFFTLENPVNRREIRYAKIIALDSEFAFYIERQKRSSLWGAMSHVTDYGLQIDE